MGCGLDTKSLRPKPTNFEKSISRLDRDEPFLTDLINISLTKFPMIFKRISQIFKTITLTFKLVQGL